MTSGYAPTLGAAGRFFCSKKERRVNTVKKTTVFSGLFVALLFVVAAQTAMAQSTIFNIPSTDTVDKGKAYGEFDILAEAPGFKQAGPVPAFRTLLINPRLVVGGPHDTEFGVNFPTYHNTQSVAGSCAGSATCGYIEPNFKIKAYKNDDEGITLVAGALLHAPINQRQA